MTESLKACASSFSACAMSLGEVIIKQIPLLILTVVFVVSVYFFIRKRKSKDE